MSDWDSFINSLNDEPTIKASVEKRYPCSICNGTGTYQGTRVHQDKKHCFACRGKGYFKTDPRKLEQQRAKRAEKKRQAIADAQESNTESGIFEAVNSMANWNEFARSLLDQHYEGKAWSEKQVNAIYSMMAKIEERQKQRQKEAAEVDLSPIINMFITAKNSGYKKPVYRAEGLKISLAPDLGANAGALYVKTTEGTYIGKVSDGKFFATRDATDEQKAAILKIAEDPREAAIRYGRQTGTCACCGRALSNKQSIELGIGPICGSKWGFM